nr:hypothetical protein [Tanacetum cinerariifolium]
MNQGRYNAAEEVATDVVPPTPTLPSLSSPVIPSLPPHQSHCPPQPQDAEGSSHLFQQDGGIKLVVDHEKDVEVEGRHADKQAEIYNIDLDHSSKVLSMQEDDTEVAAASTPIPAAKPKTLIITAAPAISTRRRKGVVIRDPEEDLPSNTPAETPTVKDKGKGILIDKATKRRKLSEEAQEADDLRRRLEIVQDESNVDAARLKLKLFKDAAVVAHAK